MEPFYIIVSVVLLRFHIRIVCGLQNFTQLFTGTCMRMADISLLGELVL